jgi:pimeloyl-ACP methyl ester carboxylesterase
MYPFLPDSLKQLQETASQQLVKQIQVCDLKVPFYPYPISTTYIQTGQETPPVLLLHGFDSSLLEFRYLVPQLTPLAQIWAVDLLGFGFTEKPLGLPYSPTAIRMHLYEFVRHQIQQPVILVGASMGGATAIDFTLAYPDWVDKVVLIDSVGYSHPPEWLTQLFFPFDFLAVEYLRQRKNLALAVGKLLGLDPHWQDLLQASAVHTDSGGWREATTTFTKSGGYRLIPSQIQQVQHPTLILWGESDSILGTQDAHRFHKDIPNSRLVWISKSDHAPQIEKPQQIAQHLSNFI